MSPERADEIFKAICWEEGDYWREHGQKIARELWDDREPLMREFVTTGEASRILGLTPQTVSQLLDRGDLQGFRIPGSTHRRVARSSIVKLTKKGDT